MEPLSFTGKFRVDINDIWDTCFEDIFRFIPDNLLQPEPILPVHEFRVPNRGVFLVGLRHV
jgi:hypothetical protein